MFWPRKKQPEPMQFWLLSYSEYNTLALSQNLASATKETINVFSWISLGEQQYMTLDLIIDYQTEIDFFGPQRYDNSDDNENIMTKH